MEQAVNQFNKGLQTDTHPLVQGNDTLSDALNATFVTMNGNEVVLQNDMGNRRVDNAFLPPGYEPVGIKEYGGVIYVASYNPITNRSQIGSFPSPERKIDSLDDKDLGCEFNFFDDFYDANESNNWERFIKTDTILTPLTKDTSLHAGDKFGLYWDLGNFSMQYSPDTYITNYNNTVGRKIKSPKNRYLTLSVGILNSQNQFVDITKNLKRWKYDYNTNKNGIVKYDSSYSEDYIFNDGYFISNYSLYNPSSYTIDDRNLIKHRQVVEANTYAYKLVGPLYLKVELNHIQEFSFGIAGNKLNINNKGIELFIEADILYNCPDTASSSNSSDNKYLSLDCGDILGWVPFIFHINEQEIYYPQSNVSWKFENPVYNEELNIYKVRAILSYRDENYDYNRPDKKILKYFIGVDSGIPVSETGEPYFIKSLSTYGEIDISKLGSGEIDLKSFRFFNNITDSGNSTTVTYSLEMYPKVNQIFKFLQIELVDVENYYDKGIEDSILIPSVEYSNDQSIDYLPFKNGRNIFSFDWDTYGIKEGRLYEVNFWYYTNDNDNVFSSKSLGVTRWLLTTKLFNDCYNSQSDNFVEDYGEKIYNPNDIEFLNTNPTEEQIRVSKILYDKLKIDFEILQNQISDEEEKLSSGKEGKLIDEYIKNKPLNYTVYNNYKIKKTINDYLNILNKDLLPSSLNIYNNRLSIEPIDILQDIDYSDFEIEQVRNGSVSTINKTENEPPIIQLNSQDYVSLISFVQDPSNDSTINKGLIQATIKCKNIVHSVNDEVGSNRNVTNGFTKINSEDFRINVLNNSTNHAGFFVGNSDWPEGKDDYHYIAAVYDKPDVSIPMKDAEEFENANGGFIFREEDEEMTFSFSDPDVKRLYENMSRSIGKKYTFAYIFSSINMVGTLQDGYEDPLAYVSSPQNYRWAGVRDRDSKPNTTRNNEAGYSPITHCKVWWRNGLSDNWVLLNSPSGLFGCDHGIDSTVPSQLDWKNEKYTYVGNAGWTNGKANVYNTAGHYNTFYMGEIGTTFINEFKFEVGINKRVQNQIMDFLDPESKVVFCLYKENISLIEKGLCTINKNNYVYNRPYSGNLTININYSPIDELKILNDTNIEEQDTYIVLSSSITNILPFYIGNINRFDEGHKINIPIKSYDEFEDDIVSIIDSNTISNIYLKDGSLKDIKGKYLSSNSFYKLDNDGNLIPIEDSPYKIYDTGEYFNSIVSNSNESSNSSTSSRYLRAEGCEDDDDAKTSLEFAGGDLRTVNYSKFQNL